MFFYDSPTLPADIFDDFLTIPQHRSDLGTRGMASMAKAGNYSAQISGHRWVAEIGEPMEYEVSRELMGFFVRFVGPTLTPSRFVIGPHH